MCVSDTCFGCCLLNSLLKSYYRFPLIVALVALVLLYFWLLSVLVLNLTLCELTYTAQIKEEFRKYRSKADRMPANNNCRHLNQRSRLARIQWKAINPWHIMAVLA